MSASIKTSYTQGPLETRPLTTSGATYTIPIVSGNRLVGQVIRIYPDREAGGESAAVESMRADANLWAAAPELLAALEAARADVYGACIVRGVDTGKVLRQVDAAIAKARGAE